MIAQNWLAHRVQRYHTNPHLARVGQTNADHAHGVASIIAMLHPEPSAALLRAALWHDAGERWAGDLPSPFKEEFPDVARQHRFAEQRLALRAAPLEPMLTPDEESWLKMADGLEALFFAALHRPNLLERADWLKHMDDVLDRAEDHGARRAIEAAIKMVIEEGMA
ncbi:MAG: hypothetical protein RLZ51_1888 [Pseudomonadota bacterium]|jgi:5'-deoxynucleotidase